MNEFDKKAVNKRFHEIENQIGNPAHVESLIQAYHELHVKPIQDELERLANAYIDLSSKHGVDIRKGDMK